MNILLTNDDGIYAEGIYALYLQLKKIGNVTVVAPDSQRSSVGHGITLSHPIWYRKCRRKGKFFGFGVSGTPADCVKFAIAIILKGKKPDVVVSGINFGPNEGCSVIYSGTVAGAREGALLGIPSIAISLATYANPNFLPAAKCSAKIVKNIFNYKIPNGTFLNVNVPHIAQSKIKGIRVVKQGMTPIHGSFHRRTDPSLREYYWMTGKMPVPKKDDGTDTFSLNKNFITIVPIQSDTTNYPYLQQLTKLKL